MTDQHGSNSTVNVSGGVNVNTQGDSSIQGDVVGRDKIVNISVQAAYAEGKILCPVDSHGDTIQKVSAIVNSTSGSLLAQKLNLPQKPTMPGYGFEMLMWVMASFVFIAIGFAFFVRTDTLGWVCGLGTVVMWFICARAVGRSLNMKKEQDQVEFDRKQQQWPKIKAVWDKTYYCHKHDAVFIAGQTQTAAPDKFYSFLSNNTSA